MITAAIGCTTPTDPVELQNQDGKADATSAGFSLPEKGSHASFGVNCEDPAGCDLKITVEVAEPFLVDTLTKANLDVRAEPHPIATVTFYGADGAPSEHAIAARPGCPPLVTCDASKTVWAGTTFEYSLPQSTTGDYVIDVDRVDSQLASLRFYIQAGWHAPTTK